MPERSSATISAVLVDDEALALNELAYLLRDFGEVEVAGTASNGIEALDLIEKIEPDLVFLDVQMPGLDGLGVIRRLREREVPLPHIVLTTAFDQYAVEAFRLEALDYLLKPVEKARLAQAIERAQRFVDERPAAELATPARTGPARSRILVRYQGRNLIVDAADIIYVTIDEGVISVVTPDFEGTANYRTIEEMQSDLDPDLFWRVHRSYLVNVNRIREVVPWFKSSFQVKMDDRKQSLIPVSRVQTKKLRMLLKL
ncbi:MAG: LytTR family DNA-binding domain-containing protein [Bryobacteraceae bacterium]|nr:LytTR family DNA-binding domain-containing protein [Bryobacteraceae bacterium]